MIKRVFDIVFSIVILFLFFWILLICWFLAIINTKTNGIFLQDRIGQYGTIFKIYKFRTINEDIVSGKRKITKIGKIFRKYKLDELLQIFNVLKGEMSIVGPRPDVPGYYNLLEGENRKILELKPGLTSQASLKYNQEEYFLQKRENPLLYNDTIIFPDKVKMNLAYFYNRSFWGDMVIILKTIECIFFRNKCTK